MVSRPSKIGLMPRCWIALQSSNSEGRSFSSSRLCLTDGVTSIQNWPDATLLDCAWPFETVRVDATKQSLLQVKVIERVDDWVLVSTSDRNAESFRRHFRKSAHARQVLNPLMEAHEWDGDATQRRLFLRLTRAL